jgi:hypothetical protein
MVTPQTVRKGTAWATRVQRLLESHGLRVERRPWMSAGDDLRVPSLRLSVEAKNHAAYSFGTWIDQAVRQCPDHLVPVVWAHRKGRAEAEDGFVVLTGRDFLRLIGTRDG